MTIYKHIATRARLAIQRLRIRAKRREVEEAMTTRVNLGCQLERLESFERELMDQLTWIAR